MYRLSLYQKFNTVQRRDAKEIIKEFQNYILWRSDGNDTLLDIGCRSGDVIVDYIIPEMPTNFQKVIGADLSENMVKLARKNYSQNSKISFMQMDITADTNELEKSIGEKVDHITSFHYLDMIQEQKKAVDNIYNLLNPEGDCVLAFLAGNNIYNTYQQLASMPKWKPYMEDIDRYITPYHYSENPAHEFAQLLYSAGFSEFNIEVRNKTSTYKQFDVLKRFLIAVYPFIDRMPYEIRGQFYDDLNTEICRLPICEEMTTTNDICVDIAYKLMVAYGRK